jgi:two-component sensor histidine kinase
MAAIRLLRRLAGRKQGVVETAAGVVLFLAVPTAVRVVLYSMLGERPCFALYFPAILGAALLLGWRVGLLVMVLSAIVADYFYIGSPMTTGLSKGGTLATVAYWLSGTLIIATAELLRRALAQLNAAAETEHALNQELRHRVNNSLALAQAFASQTMRSAPEPEVFYASFQSRLRALAQAHDILSSADWGDCEFPHLAEAALKPFADRGAITLNGGPCQVPSASCVPLVLALHELATNAVKYGALSVPAGKVALNWKIHDQVAQSEMVLQWVESGGPSVQAPTRRGLGSRLLVRQSGLDDVLVSYDPAGLQCTILVREITPPRAPLRVGPRLMATA